LEKLAQAIQQQMARRDIFIFNFEIYEFQKKKISWRQNKSDLIIKNKRFSNTGVTYESFDEDSDQNTNCCHPPEYNTCEVNTPRPALINLAPPINRLANLATPIRPSQAEKIIKKVSFVPSKMVAPVGNFTIEKSYPVFREILNTNGIGMMIETLDDKGNRVQVSDEHFVPLQQNLVGADLIDFESKGKNLSDDNLNWSGVIKNDIPKLR
jgi:hypothetical protein